MTQPVEVFKEVGRILKPGGLYLVIFSNRMFPPKAIKIWREATEQERVILVDEFFKQSNAFEKTRFFASRGKQRPKDDAYAYMGIPSDPVYALYADKKGGSPHRKPRPVVTPDSVQYPSKEEIEIRKKEVKNTFRCPYCNEKMRKWAVPQTPFTEWDNEFMYVCFNDECPYLLRGWDVMSRQGNSGISYRQMYNPERDSFLPVPVPSLDALKDGIMD
jgi:hypothetical protein